MVARSPLDPAASFRELESEHFLLQTNADSEHARALLGELEQSYAAFQKVAFPYVLPLRGVTRVIALENLDDLSDFGWANTAGRYAWRITPFESTRFVILTKPRASRAFDRSLYQHEIAHRFIGYYHPGIPRWMNEGLAEYYSTLRFDGDQVVIGEYLGDTTFSSVPYDATYRNGVLVLPISRIPTSATVRSLSPDSFYTERWLATRLNYVAAWSLVHTLTTLPNGLGRLDSYLDALHTAQVSEDQAWHQAFGEVSESELEKRFQSFLSANETITWRAKLRYEAVAPLSERALSSSETHTLLAEIHATHQQGQAKALEELERAIAADPRDPEPYFLRGSLEFSLDAPEKVRPDFERAHSLAPLEGRYATAVAEFDFHAAPGERELKALSPRVGRLLPLARTAFDYRFIARYSLAAGRQAAASKYATKAIQADSSCFSCFATAAEVALSDGKLKLAIQLQKTAINLLPHGVSSRCLVERLAAMQGVEVPVERSEAAPQSLQK